MGIPAANTNEFRGFKHSPRRGSLPHGTRSASCSFLRWACTPRNLATCSLVRRAITPPRASILETRGVGVVPNAIWRTAGWRCQAISLAALRAGPTGHTHDTPTLSNPGSSGSAIPSPKNGFSSGVRSLMPVSNSSIRSWPVGRMFARALPRASAVLCWDDRNPGSMAGTVRRPPPEGRVSQAEQSKKLYAWLALPASRSNASAIR